MPTLPTAFVESDTVLHSICLGCGICSMICPTKALHTGEKTQAIGGDRMPSLQSTLCVHCGNCASVCPSNTIHQPRLRQFASEVQTQPTHSVVFVCRNLSTLSSPCAEKQGFPPKGDLLAAHTSPRLTDLHVPQGARIELVRCVHRVGPRFLDKLVECGVRNVLLLACKDQECRYHHGSFHRIPHIEMLRAVYEAYGITVHMEMLYVNTPEILQMQDMIDNFMAESITVGPCCE